MPPNLDVRTEPSPSQDLISFYDKILDGLYGVACRLDDEGRVAEVSASWDELANRTGNAELARNSVLGKPFWDIAPDDETRLTLRGAFGSLARGLTSHAQHTLELSSGPKPLPLQFAIHAIRNGELCTGFLVQGVDGTAEHVARLALLDRERKLRELRSLDEQRRSQIANFEEQVVLLNMAQQEKDEEIAAQREQQAALIEQMAAWNSAHEEDQLQIAELQSEKTLLQEETRDLKRRITLLDEQLTALREQQTTGSEQATRWNAQFEEDQRQIAQLQSERTRLQDELIEREQQMNAVRLQADELRRRIADLEHNCETLEVVHRERETRSKNQSVAWENTVTDALSAFQRSPEHFPSEFCRMAAQCGEAMFATLAVYTAASERFSYMAQHGAPDFHQYMIENQVVELALGEGPAGIAAERGCPTKFDHLLERADFTTWAPLAEQNGYHCIWAVPLTDEEGIYGVLQLYYVDEDVNLSVENLERLSSLTQLVLPLLRAGKTWQASGEETLETASPIEHEDGFRALATDLAEEFSNLLTGVLGHSSLVAAEMGESSTAVEDIRAIERSARGAARLTRRLSALCGANHKSPPPVDLAGYLKKYARDHAKFFANDKNALAPPDSPCSVPIENPTLEIILDGMAEHAMQASHGGENLQWTLTTDESAAVLSLTYPGPPLLPPQWENGRNPTRHKSPLPEIVFAREAARAHGGSLEIRENDHSTDIVLRLPLFTQPAEQTA